MTARHAPGQKAAAAQKLDFNPSQSTAWIRIFAQITLTNEHWLTWQQVLLVLDTERFRQLFAADCIFLAGAWSVSCTLLGGWGYAFCGRHDHRGPDASGGVALHLHR